jgi:pimeloyl-ACP methyl ester carboxylesterase
VINDIGPHTDSVALKIISKYVCNYTEFNSIEEVSKYIRIFLRPLNIKSNEHWDHMIKYSVKKTKNNSYVLDFDPQILVNFKNNANKNRDIWSIWNDIDRKIPILILRGEKSIMLTKETLLKMLESKDQIDFIEYSDVGHTPSLLEIQQLEDIKNWITKKLSQQK